MKILLVSGFLGAGKTSFIKYLSERTKKKFVIIENEFADEDVDSNILKSEDKNASEMDIMSISDGCICCSMNLSFAHSVMTVANTLDPDYLIVEPSGVARPKKIIDDLSKILYDRIGLLVPILIVDGKNYRRAFDEFSDLYGKDLLAISRVFVSKSENYTLEDFTKVKNDLEIESEHFLTTHYSELSDEAIEHILNDRLVIRPDDEIEIAVEEGAPPSKTETLRSLSVTDGRDIHPGEMALFLEQVIRHAYGDILRSKGIFKYGENQFRFELVEGDYVIGGFEKSDGKMIFIGAEINEAALRAFLEKN